MRMHEAREGVIRVIHPSRDTRTKKCGRNNPLIRGDGVASSCWTRERSGVSTAVFNSIEAIEPHARGSQAECQHAFTTRGLQWQLTHGDDDCGARVGNESTTASRRSGGANSPLAQYPTVAFLMDLPGGSESNAGNPPRDH